MQRKSKSDQKYCDVRSIIVDFKHVPSNLDNTNSHYSNLYSSVSVLAASKIFFHSLLSNTLRLHHLTLSNIRSSSVPSINLSFGLATLLHTTRFRRVIFNTFIITTRITRPAHRDLPNFTVLKIPGSENSSYDSLLYARIHSHTLDQISFEVTSFQRPSSSPH
jgi:hypothetical protein